MGGREEGEKVKAGPRDWHLEGWLGEERSSYTQWNHPRLEVQQGWGRCWGRTWEGAWRNRREHSQHFPCPLRHQEPVGLQGLILCTGNLPPTMQSPSPTPTPPPKALSLHSETPSETPSNCTGPKSHPHTLTQGLTSKLRNPHSTHAASPLPGRS